jgi:hypothetical protein
MTDEDRCDERKTFEENRERIGRVKIPEAVCANLCRRGRDKKLATRIVARPMMAVNARVRLSIFPKRLRHKDEEAQDEHVDFKGRALIIIASGVK